jgi:hypothetical protein
MLRTKYIGRHQNDLNRMTLTNAHPMLLCAIPFVMIGFATQVDVSLVPRRSR